MTLTQQVQATIKAVSDMINDPAFKQSTKGTNIGDVLSAHVNALGAANTPSQALIAEPGASDFFEMITGRYQSLISDDEDRRRFKSDLFAFWRAAVRESVKPWQEALTDAAMRTAGPLRFFVDNSEAALGSQIELWRGEFHGYWFRIVVIDHFTRLYLQRNCGVGAPAEIDSWETVWAA